MVGILFAVALFYCTPALFRTVDPTAGGFDMGVLHLFVFAVVGVLTFSFLSWVGIKINFGEMFDYLQTDFTADFKKLTPWQKILVALCCYFAYLFAFILTASVL